MTKLGSKPIPPKNAKQAKAWGVPWPPRGAPKAAKKVRSHKAKPVPPPPKPAEPKPFLPEARRPTAPTVLELWRRVQTQRATIDEQNIRWALSLEGQMEKVLEELVQMARDIRAQG